MIPERAAGELPAQQVPDEPQLSRVFVAELTLADGVLAVTKQVSITPFRADMGPVDITASDLSTLPADEGEKKIIVRADSGTRLALVGSRRLDPLAAAGSVTGHAPCVPLIHRYVQDRVALEAASGDLELSSDFWLETDVDGIAAGIDKLGMIFGKLGLHPG